MKTESKIFVYPLLIILAGFWCFCLFSMGGYPLELIDYTYNDYVHICALDTIEETDSNIDKYRLNLWEHDYDYCESCGIAIEDNVYIVNTNQCLNCKTISKGEFCTKCGAATTTEYEKFDISTFDSARLKFAKFAYIIIYALLFIFLDLGEHYSELIDDIEIAFCSIEERFSEKKKNKK